MNVMNSNNLDNRLQSKFENPTKRIKMGEEKKIVMKLRTSAMEGGRECTAKANYKEHIGMVRPTKVSMVEIEGKKTKRKRKSPLIPWKKPEGMPKRPLSAYNLFFQDRRKSIMLGASESAKNLLEESKQAHRKPSKKKSGVGFANLARTIGTEWRALDPEKKNPYDSLAANDKERYDREMKVWRAKEKEEKSTRESDLIATTPSFGCVTALPTYTSILASRKDLGDAHSSRNNATETSLPMTGINTGDQSVDILQPLNDHDSRGLFHSSIYSNYNNNSYSIDASSDQTSNRTVHQQQQDAIAYSPTLHMTDKMQLAQFNNSVVKDHLEQSSIVRENFPYPYNFGAMSATGSAQSNQYQTQPYVLSGSISNNSSKTMPWSVPRNTLNMDNMASTSIDLEPLPLPENHYQQLQQMLGHKTTRNSQVDWSGQQLGLQQMRAKEQHQQRITIASNGQYLQRLAPGGTSLFPAGWGHHPNSWYEKNTNAVDVNDSTLIAVTLDDGNVNQESSGKNSITSTATNMISQALGNNILDSAKSRDDDTRSFPSSSNTSNQDPWKPIGFFNEEQN